MQKCYYNNHKIKCEHYQATKLAQEIKPLSYWRKAGERSDVKTNAEL
jgi:hypothetical protein